MKQIYILPALCLMSGLAVGQVTYPSDTILSSEESQVLKIERQKRSIDSAIPSYNKIEKSRDSLGYRIVYYDGKELRLIEVFYKENGIDKKASWYFNKGLLFYCESEWIRADGNRISDDEKYYLADEHLIKWIIGENDVDTNSYGFLKAAKSIADYALKLKLENTYP